VSLVESENLQSESETSKFILVPSRVRVQTFLAEQSPSPGFFSESESESGPVQVRIL